jgi:ubiquitin C-terminal hydrolase
MYQTIIHEWMVEYMNRFDERGLRLLLNKQERARPVVPFLFSEVDPWIYRLPVHAWTFSQQFCPSCLYPSTSQYHYMDTLTLTVSGSFHSANLQDLLGTAWQPEHVSGTICRHCGYPPSRSGAASTEVQSSIKRSEMSIFPKTLCLQLPIISYDSSGRIYKHTSTIAPLSYLDAASFMSPHRPSVTYQLKSLIVHIGTATQGHYVTYRLSDDQKWFKLSDEAVTRVKWQEIADSNPYLLFYEQRQPPPH